MGCGLAGALVFMALPDSLPSVALAVTVSAGLCTMMVVGARRYRLPLSRPGPRTTSLFLITAGSVIALAGGIGYRLFFGAVPETVQYGSVVVAYALWAGAAGHLSTAHAAAGDRAGPGRGRLLVFTASTLLIPAVLLVQGDRGASGMSLVAVAVSSMVLFLLVAIRMNGYLSRVDSQAGQLRDLLLRDDLTGLPNRRAFEQQAATAVAAAPCHMIMIDLAGFKHVNGRLGRAAGDQALTAVARLLRDCVRDGDVVARMGADEFAVLVHDTQPGAGLAVAGRVRDLLRHPVQAGERELLLNARLGVAGSGPCESSPPCPAEGDEPCPDGRLAAAELVRRADTARYAAKSTGGQLVEYTPALDERAEIAESLGADLRHSLDDGGFHVVYQPIVDLRDGSTVAVEALVRWVHPVRGFVGPDVFIPVAEDNGLIVELGEWIMRTACLRLAGWRSALGAAAPLYISVNVSARQLSEPGFPAVVTTILAEAGLEPAALLVEVTETAIFGGGIAIEAVETLHRSGIRIALDDFGTGHSSLGLLRTVPVDVLKIDKSFVDEITEAGRKAVIVDALIHVVNGLELRAVAEGVETEEQAQYLRDLGYQFAQGYLFGRPVPDPVTPAAIAPAPVTPAAIAPAPVTPDPITPAPTSLAV